MLLIPVPIVRKRRARVRRTPPAPPVVAAPVLVSASYDAGTSVTLTFDRAIDIAGLDPGAIVVDDGPGEATQYEGTGPATLTSPTTVEVSLTPIDSSSSAVVLLDASPATGIVAAVGAVAWAGVTSLELPFP